MQIEEEVSYPVSCEALGGDDDDLLDEAGVEHAGAKNLIAHVEASKAGEHHVKEEETQLFPERRASSMDLKALGLQLATRKAELLIAAQ